MIFRGLTSDNDWTFGKGRENYARLNTAVGLNVKTRILSWVGDCFFALQEGIDWANRLDKNQQDLLENDLRRIILQSENVVGINSFDIIFNPETRGFRADYSINTIYSKEYVDSIEVNF